MIVLSHRGHWKTPEEKNTVAAFERSFAQGFGTETDIRDHRGELVIAHDMPDDSALPLRDFLALYKRYDGDVPLALNIKADGLQQPLRELLHTYDITHYFVFDMAVPDGLGYVRADFRTFTRHSEYEPTPAFYTLADGVWLDAFDGQWITDTTITEHLTQQKAVCIVSPELHRRDHQPAWQQYKALEARIGRDRLMLCTDFPEQAQEYFNAAH